MPEENILQLGAIAIIFIFFLKEFFAYLKSKKSNGINGEMLKELKMMNENHLSSIKNEITKGNKETVGAINQLGDKMDNLISGTARLLGRSDKL